eukprot:scaffold614980_cov38-Prasinocladus_malaysianus.AAC.1
MRRAKQGDARGSRVLVNHVEQSTEPEFSMGCASSWPGGSWMKPFGAKCNMWGDIEHLSHAYAARHLGFFIS